MRQVRVDLRSISPYQQGQVLTEEHLEREDRHAYEVRNWKHRAHYNADGQVFIPPQALKMALETAAALSSCSGLQTG